jgi:hypothetical protein
MNHAFPNGGRITIPGYELHIFTVFPKTCKCFKSSNPFGANLGQRYSSRQKPTKLIHALSKTLEVLRYLKSQDDLPWLCAGDFNKVLAQHKNLGIN